MRKAHASHDANPTSVRQRIGHPTKNCSILLAGFTTLLVLLRYVCLPIIAYTSPYMQILDTGIYGAYSEKQYISTDLRSPHGNVARWDDSCDDGGLILLSLDGESLGNSGPLIVDMRGNLIWKSDEYAMSWNANIQVYKGQNYITFWAGEELQESGLGMYYMLDSSYEVACTVSAVGNVKGDLHEFKITPGGTALVTVYERVRMNLSAYTADIELKNDDILLIDGIFQEIDIATGELLFEWHASDHLNDDHARYMGTSYGGYIADGAFDYFHINSVEKDTRGNFLVSLRHLHTIVYVSGNTGEILWAIGGNAKDFQDISNGGASNFSWQHDARWVSEEQGIISLFDNGMAHKHYDVNDSRGRLIQLNVDDWTAELLHEYTALYGIGSASHGNVQLLESAKHDREPHMFIGWGTSAAFTEHTLSGELLCETHLGASWLFYFERIKSYRSFKTFGWKGTPKWDPEVQIEGDQLLVSWNGATEVVDWVLRGKRRLQDDFEDVDIIRKDEAFESSFDLPGDHFIIYQVVALNEDGHFLGSSREVLYKDGSRVRLMMRSLVFLVSFFAVCSLAYKSRYFDDSTALAGGVDGYVSIKSSSKEEEPAEIDTGLGKMSQYEMQLQSPTVFSKLLDL